MADIDEEVRQKLERYHRLKERVRHGQYQYTARFSRSMSTAGADNLLQNAGAFTSEGNHMYRSHDKEGAELFVSFYTDDQRVIRKIKQQGVKVFKDGHQV